MYISLTPPSRIVRGPDVQTGLKINKNYSRKTLGENICELRECRDMEKTNRVGDDTLTDEVKVDLDVFGALILHQVSREVDYTHIVTLDKGGILQRLSQFLKELS
jgi:hypothetical protein